MTRKTRKRKGKETKKLTCAVTHIRLIEMNPGKLEALDALAQVYMDLCQHYVTVFCTEKQPDKYHAPLFTSPLSQRWHRVAIQQAAGIAQSWRTNRETAYQAYLEERADYQEQQASEQPDPTWKEPVWTEWNVPTLQAICIQANVNVVAMEASTDSTFDYWLKISTLEKGSPLLVPVKLADYHRTALAGQTLHTSTTLNKRPDGWWLTVTYDKVVPVKTENLASIVGVDIGIANFLTSSTGKHYGTFHGKLAHRHKVDREKRRRKAKLRACLKKKGITKLPSTTNKKLARHVRQEINKAVNDFYTDHPTVQVAYEQLSVASMRFKTRQMNSYLYASNLGHIPKQLEWGAQKRGIRATWVKSAYSSQECSVCHFVDRANRPNQQTFCCRVCGYTAHADHNAAANMVQRFGDIQLQACPTKAEVKALLMRRHAAYVEQQRLVVVQPPAQLVLFEHSTGVG